MIGGRAFAAIVSGAALAASVVAPAALAAQGNARGSGQPAYHLIQLSVERESVPMKEFQAQTETIKSCGDARKIGRAMGADIKRNRYVASWNLTSSVKDMLEAMEIGEASEVFTDDGDVLRVLVICNLA